MVKQGLQGWLLTKSCCIRLMLQWSRQLLKAVRDCSIHEAAKVGFKAYGHTGAERLASLAADKVLELDFLVSVLSEQGGRTLVMSLLMVPRHSVSISTCQL